MLRNRRFAGVKFRRQYAIESYIVDFCCPEKKVIIELDGSGHGELKQGKKDQSRDKYLTTQGYKIIRAWNIDLDQNFEGMMETIYSAVGSLSPSPQPSPSRGEGEKNDSPPHHPKRPLRGQHLPKGRVIKNHTAYIGIGANLGDAKAQCLTAMEHLSRIPGIELGRCSSLYRSLPLRPPHPNPLPDGPLYVNAVCEIRTDLTPHALLGALKEIEKKLGRKERERWASREIDLDLLFFDDNVVNTETLTLPHPELHKRGFVLKPLMEMAPGLRHPVLGKTVAELEENLEDLLKVKKINQGGMDSR